MIWPKAHGPSSAGRYAFGLMEGMDWICIHDAFAFRKCNHTISSHIGTILTRSLMTRLTWPSESRRPKTPRLEILL